MLSLKGILKTALTACTCLVMSGCSLSVQAPGFNVEYSRGNFGGITYESYTDEGSHKVFSTGNPGDAPKNP